MSPECMFVFRLTAGSPYFSVWIERVWEVEGRGEAM